MVVFLPLSLNAGPYVEVGLGVPLSPDKGYIPDLYGIASIGYFHRIDRRISIDLGFVHRSLTGIDTCNNNNCTGDDTIETKLRFEW